MLEEIDTLRSRTPHGVRELKLLIGLVLARAICRTPHGVRELKRRYTTINS